MNWHLRPGRRPVINESGGSDVLKRRQRKGKNMLRPVLIETRKLNQFD
jgi:hypothetical protein